MLDSLLRPTIDRVTSPLAAGLAARGVGAGTISVLGAALGLGGASAIAMGAPLVGLALFIAGRIADGLDGPVARASPTGRTDWGGYLDIVLDFLVYAAIPLAFAAADPAVNGLPAALLLAAFLANGSAFLAFAALARERGLETSHQGPKSFYFLAGLAEGAETVVAFTAMCLFPKQFPVIAIVFAALCFVSAAARVATARALLR